MDLGSDGMYGDLLSLRVLSDESGQRCPLDVVFPDQLSRESAAQAIGERFESFFCGRGGGLWVQGKLPSSSHKELANTLKELFGALYTVQMVG